MLRNAFDLIATEGTLRQLLRQLTLAKTLSDVLRVNVDNTVSVVGTVGLNNASSGNAMAGAGVSPGLWSNTSWNTVDARYAYGEQQIMNFIQNRERWTIS